MNVVTFLLLIVVAGLAAGARVLIVSTPPPERGRLFAACLVAYALLLTLPALLPRLLGG